MSTCCFDTPACVQPMSSSSIACPISIRGQGQMVKPPAGRQQGRMVKLMKRIDPIRVPKGLHGLILWANEAYSFQEAFPGLQDIKSGPKTIKNVKRTSNNMFYSCVPKRKSNRRLLKFWDFFTSWERFQRLHGSHTLHLPQMWNYGKARGPGSYAFT